MRVCEFPLKIFRYTYLRPSTPGSQLFRFAKVRDKRDWFLRNEVRLFEFRLERLRNIKIRDVENQSKLEHFLHCQGIEYESVCGICARVMFRRS